MRFLPLLTAVLLALSLMGLAAPLAGPAFAQTQAESAGAESTASPEDVLARWDAEATQIERRLESGGLTLDDISRHRAELQHQLTEITPLKNRLDGRVAPLREQLSALGDPPEDASTEAPQISMERRRLQEEISKVEALIKRADQGEARALGLIDRLTALRQQLFTDQLLTRGPSIIDAGMPRAAIAELIRVGRNVVRETRQRWSLRTMDVPVAVTILAPILPLVGLAILLLRLRDILIKRQVRNLGEETPYSRRVTAGAAITLARLLLPAAAVGILLLAARLSGLLGTQGTLLLQGLAAAAGVLIGAYGLGGAFFAPQSRLLRLSRLGDGEARRAHRWLMVLALIVGLDRALVQQGQALLLGVEGLALLNIGLVTHGGIALAGFVRCVRGRPPEPVEEAQPTQDAADEDAEEGERRAAASDAQVARSLVGFARLIGYASAIAAPLLALAGFYAAARFAFYPVVFSGAVISFCVLLFHVVRALVDHLVASDQTQGSAFDRLQLIPILVAVVLACAALPVLALIWGADGADLSEMLRLAVVGFQIGEVRLSPVDFLMFGLVLAIGLVVTRKLRVLLSRNVLPLTGLDTGGRDAVAAGFGYLGVVVSALIAISTTGLDLSNLAIVAGALSVGIGFGLQNIVNNFVSGVILLIERPIKAGDWIQLPSGMGYVKKINVRSTEVETFDRSSLFVPNSELISGPVTNWTHSNLNGRVIVPVRVRYDSDVRLVERVLLEIAKGHPLMLRRPAPFVLFHGFGQDGLDFEIRGILRDVNWVLNVASDIRFEVHRRFEEEGIVIPFRQTDVHLRDLDAVGATLGEALSRRGNGADRPANGVEAAPTRTPGPRPYAQAARDGDAVDGTPDADAGGAGDGR